MIKLFGEYNDLPEDSDIKQKRPVFDRLHARAVYDAIGLVDKAVKDAGILVDPLRDGTIDKLTNTALAYTQREDDRGISGWVLRRAVRAEVKKRIAEVVAADKAATAESSDTLDFPLSRENIEMLDSPKLRADYEYCVAFFAEISHIIGPKRFPAFERVIEILKNQGNKRLNALRYEVGQRKPRITSAPDGTLKEVAEPINVRLVIAPRMSAENIASLKRFDIIYFSPEESTTPPTITNTDADGCVGLIQEDKTRLPGENAGKTYVAETKRLAKLGLDLPNEALHIVFWYMRKHEGDGDIAPSIFQKTAKAKTSPQENVPYGSGNLLDHPVIGALDPERTDVPMFSQPAIIIDIYNISLSTAPLFKLPSSQQ